MRHDPDGCERYQEGNQQKELWLMMRIDDVAVIPLCNIIAESSQIEHFASLSVWHLTPELGLPVGGCLARTYRPESNGRWPVPDRQVQERENRTTGVSDQLALIHTVRPTDGAIFSIQG